MASDSPANFPRRYIVLFAGVAIGLVLIGGWLALPGVGLEGAEEEQDETAITQQEFRSITPGMREAEVRRRLGRPADVGPVGQVIAEQCIYYKKQDKPLSEGSFQFCFEGGRLTAKYAY
jgi:hypothetical protein